MLVCVEAGRNHEDQISHVVAHIYFMYCVLQLQCLMKLLECGASCDAATERLNQSPAHIAAYGGQSHCLKWLLHCGATICRQVTYGASLNYCLMSS